MVCRQNAIPSNVTLLWREDFPRFQSEAAENRNGVSTMKRRLEVNGLGSWEVVTTFKEPPRPLGFYVIPWDRCIGRDFPQCVRAPPCVPRLLTASSFPRPSAAFFLTYARPLMRCFAMLSGQGVSSGVSARAARTSSSEKGRSTMTWTTTSAVRATTAVRQAGGW